MQTIGPILYSSAIVARQCHHGGCKRFMFFTKVIFAFAAFMVANAASAQQVAKSIIATNGVRIGFYEYKPANYNSNSTVKYPLIIFLHGIGESGNGTTELWKVKRFAIPAYIDKGHDMTFTWNGKTETFLVLSPQCAVTTRWYYSNYYVDEMIRYAKQNLRVDPDRIILTGLSMGGGGTWAYATDNAANAAQLAAVAPVSAPCYDTTMTYHPRMANGSLIAKSNLPVWSFHAVDDANTSTPVQCAHDAVDSINKYNPKVKPLKTIYQRGGHFIWDQAYNTGSTHQSPNLFEWFLAQNRSLPPNSLPVTNAGADTAILAKDGIATLDGRKSSDSDGKIVKSTWRKIAGGNGGEIVSAGALLTTVKGLQAVGTYTYELQTADDRVGWTADTVSISVVNELPAVQYLSFDANVEKGNLVNLNWSTSRERSTKAFEVERSANRVDFSKIGSINSAGNSEQVMEYSFRDQNPLPDSNHYRLKHVYTNDQFAYSNVISVHIPVIENVEVTPNPATVVIRVRSMSSEPMSSVQLLETNGRLMKQTTFNSQGMHDMTIDVRNVPRGLYFLRVICRNIIAVKRVVLR
jgi:poly(3-hydroxybutyrate) depolymerase